MSETEEVVVTFLAMDAPPRTPVPPAPVGPRLAVLVAEDPPVEWFVYLYRAVGAPYRWTEWTEDATEEERRAFVADPKTSVHTLMLDGWPGGFFMLDRRVPAVCDLSYFGLVPQAVGRGLGHWFLRMAVDAAWSDPGCVRLTVNTCTLDHPRALATYQKAGFEAVRRETRRV
ncbi:MAG: GNAT family N-acetyltransferase [Paracoccaceae bacterium]